MQTFLPFVNRPHQAPPSSLVTFLVLPRRASWLSNSLKSFRYKQRSSSPFFYPTLYPQKPQISSFIFPSFFILYPYYKTNNLTNACHFGKIFLRNFNFCHFAFGVDYLMLYIQNSSQKFSREINFLLLTFKIYHK